jgi:large subunit ribosomal protein L9
MKVIFTEDVPNVARAGDIKDVADGYARNYLIPRKLAILASPGAINAMAVKIEARTRSDAKTEAEMLELAKSVDGREIFIEAKSGGKEKLYGSVTAADIAEELERATGLSVDKKKIKLPESIHQLGTYDVEIRLAKDIEPKIKVTITEKETEKLL